MVFVCWGRDLPAQQRSSVEPAHPLSYQACERGGQRGCPVVVGRSLVAPLIEAGNSEMRAASALSPKQALPLGRAHDGVRTPSNGEADPRQDSGKGKTWLRRRCSGGKA